MQTLRGGTSAARPINISFWVRSSVIGQYTGNVRNNDDTRICPFNYSISAANTWEFKTVTIPGCPDGTWLTNNDIGLRLQLYVAMGSTYLGGVDGAWNSTTKYGSGTPVNGLNANGNIFAITGVQLEAGPTATPFERRPYSVELGMCEHYYQVVELSGGPVNLYPTTGTGYFQIPYKTMRAIPSVVFDASINNGGFIYFNAVSVACAYSINAPASRNSISAKIDRTSGIFGAGEVCGHTYIRLKLSAEF